MNKWFKVQLLVVALLALAVSAQAVVSEDHWRILAKADDGSGGGYGTSLQIGVYPTSTDGVDGEDRTAAFGVDLSKSTRWAVGTIPGSASLFERDIMSPAPPSAYPTRRKVWNLRVAALSNATNSPIRLRFCTTSTNPALTAGGRPFNFELQMLDNKGMQGAPDNGTTWLIPVPTQASSTDFWWLNTAADVNGHVWDNLPIIKTSANDYATFLNEGYVMEFAMVTVPEPASLTALGIGACSLGLGLLRRRRSF